MFALQQICYKEQRITDTDGSGNILSYLSNQNLARTVDSITRNTTAAEDRQHTSILDYRTISLISHPNTVRLRVMLNRIKGRQTNCCRKNVHNFDRNDIPPKKTLEFEGSSLRIGICHQGHSKYTSKKGTSSSRARRCMPF